MAPEHSTTHQSDENFNLTSASVEHTRSIHCCLDVMAILIGPVCIAGVSANLTCAANPLPYLCDVTSKGKLLILERDGWFDWFD